MALAVISNWSKLALQLGMVSLKRPKASSSLNLDIVSQSHEFRSLYVLVCCQLLILHPGQHGAAAWGGLQELQGIVIIQHLDGVSKRKVLIEAF